MESVNDTSVLELLLKIHGDVQAIKTEVANLAKENAILKDSTQKDNEVINNRVDELDIRIVKVENSIIDLKHQDEIKDAKKYRSIIKYIFTGILGLFIGQLPSLILIVFKAIQQGG